MPNGNSEITFEVPDGLTKTDLDRQLDTSYAHPVASRLLEAARAQLSDPDELSFTLSVKVT